MKRARYVLSLDGVGIARPTHVRAKALRSRRWWSKRCPGLDLDVVRLPTVPA